MTWYLFLFLCASWSSTSLFYICVRLGRIADALEREGARRDRVAMLEREGVE